MFNGKEYIYEIYKAGSFSKAAKNLFISQPALSSAVKKIEEDLGTRIFNRSTNPVTLTETGKAYISAVQQIMTLENNFRDQIQNINELQTGYLNVGGANFFSSCMLPSIIKNFRKLYANIKIEITESDSIDLYNNALERPIDLILDAGSYDHNLFTAHYIATENILLGIPVEHPINKKLRKDQLTYEDILSNAHLETKKCIDLSSLANEHFILLKPGHDMFSRTMKICQNFGFTPQEDTLYLNQLMTAYNLGTQGLGLIFVTDTLIKLANHQDSMLYYRINDKFAQRDIFLAHRKNAVITKAMEKFIDITKDIYSAK